MSDYVFPAVGNKLIYIAPHRAARGEKKLKPQQYELR